MTREEIRNRRSSLDVWPVTVVFDGEVGLTRTMTSSNEAWTMTYRSIAMEFRNIMEAEEFLIGKGMEPRGPRILGHVLAYGNDTGCARISFEPACILAEYCAGDIMDAMDGGADVVRTLDSLGVKAMEIPGLHHH